MQPVKHKKLTYLLICVVTAVWGVIIYRLFFNEEDVAYKPGFVAVEPKKEPYDQYQVNNDTARLRLNYRDPFINTTDIEPDAKEPDLSGHRPPVNLNPPVVPAPVDWSTIKYAGYIINPVTKKLVSVIVVNNRERMLAEGEIFEGVKLLKNKRDSILVSWRGKQKYIRQ